MKTELITYFTDLGFTKNKDKYFQKDDMEIFINDKTLTCWKSQGTFFVLPIQENTIEILQLIFAKCLKNFNTY
jgi:hypothetical protein